MSKTSAQKFSLHTRIQSILPRHNPRFEVLDEQVQGNVGTSPSHTAISLVRADIVTVSTNVTSVDEIVNASTDSPLERLPAQY